MHAEAPVYARREHVRGDVHRVARDEPPALRERSGQLVGFRPEHVQLGNGKPNCAHCDATVEVVQYLGDEQLAYLRLGDAPFHTLLIFESGDAVGSVA